MDAFVLHEGVIPALPVDVGTAVLAVGVVVFAVIAYDIYRQQWARAD